MVIPTIKNAFSCVVTHPKVIVPFFVFFLLFGSIFVYALRRFFELFSMIASPEAFASPEEAPFAVMGIFSFFAFIFLIILFVFFAFPFFEGWTFAAAGSAFKNEPVSLGGTAKRALSTYIGVLVITFIMVVVWLVIGSILSIIMSVVMFFIMASFAPAPSVSPAPSAAQISGIFVVYAIMIVIMIVFMVFFVYMKPAYVVGKKRVFESLGDGFDTAKANFVPSFVIVLFFVVVLVVLYGIVWGVFTVSGVLDFEHLMYPDFTGMHSLFPVLIGVGVVMGIVYLVVYSAFYAALTYAYMDSHEMINT